MSLETAEALADKMNPSLQKRAVMECLRQQAGGQDRSEPVLIPLTIFKDELFTQGGNGMVLAELMAVVASANPLHTTAWIADISRPLLTGHHITVSKQYVMGVTLGIFIAEFEIWKGHYHHAEHQMVYDVAICEVCTSYLISQLQFTDDELRRFGGWVAKPVSDWVRGPKNHEDDQWLRAHQLNERLVTRYFDQHRKLNPLGEIVCNKFGHTLFERLPAESKMRATHLFLDDLLARHGKSLGLE